MNLNDLILSKNSDRNKFLKACLPLETWQEGQSEYLETKAMLDRAQTSEEFIRLLLNSDTMCGTQIYAELSKSQPDHWKRVRDSIDNWISTYSDAGGLKIGNEYFSITVPNGYGDGDMKYAVVGRGCLNHDMLEFWTVIQGNQINIYDYDCGSDIIETLDGRFGVFYGYGFIVFEKWN